jgi:hypothetical protein
MFGQETSNKHASGPGDGTAFAKESVEMQGVLQRAWHTVCFILARDDAR